MLALFPLVASASTFARIPDLAELAERSSSVVEGRVTEVVSQPAPYGVDSRYRIAVDRTLSGAPRAEVVVSLPGGRDRGLVQRFSGVPLWSPGDEVVVFVPRDGDPQPLSGVFTREGDRLVDPIERPAAPTSVADLERRIADQPPGEADDDPVWALGRTDAGTSDQ